MENRVEILLKNDKYRSSKKTGTVPGSPPGVLSLANINENSSTDITFSLYGLYH